MQLAPIGVRPPLRGYLRECLRRRAFVREMVTARVDAQHAHTLLGAGWLILTPLLNAGLYFVVFGVLLGASSAVPHYPLFLLVGVLLFTYFSRACSTASTALARQRDLVRALPFPRLVLVVASIGVETSHLGWSVLVLVVVAVLSVGVGAGWLMAAGGLALLVLLAVGVGLTLARLVVTLPDAGGMLPFALRALGYLSGAYFPLSIAEDRLPWLTAVLQWNPVAACLTIVRSGLTEVPIETSTWLVAGGWALLAVVAGVIVFWRGEPGYGRD